MITSTSILISPVYSILTKQHHTLNNKEGKVKYRSVFSAKKIEQCSASSNHHLVSMSSKKQIILASAYEEGTQNHNDTTATSGDLKDEEESSLGMFMICF